MNANDIIRRRKELFDNIYDSDTQNHYLLKYEEVLDKISSNDSNYKHINDDHFIIASKITLGGHEVLKFHCFFIVEKIISSAKIEEIINNAKAFFSISEIETAVMLDGTQIAEINILKELGYSPYSITTVGETRNLQNLKINDKNFTNFSVRLAQESDIESIYNIEEQAQSKAPDNKIDFKAPSTKEMMVGMYTDMINRKSAFVIESSEKELIGAACTVTNYDYNTAFLASIAVLPQYQGKGISKLLYNQIYELCAIANDKYYRSATTNNLILEISKKTKRTVLEWTMVKKS